MRPPQLVSLYTERPRLATRVPVKSATLREIAFWPICVPLTYTVNWPVVPLMTVVYRLMPAGVRAPTVAEFVPPGPTSVLHGDVALSVLVRTDLTYPLGFDGFSSQ